MTPWPSWKRSLPRADTSARRRLLSSILAALLILGLQGSVHAIAQTTGAATDEALRRFLESTIAASASFEDRFEAEVWLVDMSARLESLLPDADDRLRLLRQVHAAATRAELPPALVLAVIEVESHFDRFAISRVGAQGLMQVMPFWKDEIGRPGDNLTDNATNLDYGCRILQFYLQREDGVLPKALAAYNGSSGSTTYSDKVETAWREHWRTSNLDWSD